MPSLWYIRDFYYLEHTKLRYSWSKQNGAFQAIKHFDISTETTNRNCRRQSTVSSIFLPVRSEGTRNFLLSISWIEDFGAFSTTTCDRRTLISLPSNKYTRWNHITYRDSVWILGPYLRRFMTSRFYKPKFRSHNQLNFISMFRRANIKYLRNALLWISTSFLSQKSIKHNEDSPFHFCSLLRKLIFQMFEHVTECYFPLWRRKIV